MKDRRSDFSLRNHDYPDHVLKGIKESLNQAYQGQLIPYTGIEDMLNCNDIEIENCPDEPLIP